MITFVIFLAATFLITLSFQMLCYMKYRESGSRACASDNLAHLEAFCQN